MAAIAKNAANGCNLTGPRWSGDRNGHFRWCMGARSTLLPWGSTTPVMPLVDGTTTQRPVSMARSREMSHCCSGCEVPVKAALLVWTTIICAPPSTARRVTLS